MYEMSYIIECVIIHLVLPFKFGGDPNLVTVMGYSSGAMSVSLHMVSPMSKGKKKVFANFSLQ